MRRSTPPLVAAALLTALAACASDGACRCTITEMSTSECQVAVDSAQCPMAYDMAAAIPSRAAAAAGIEADAAHAPLGSERGRERIGLPELAAACSSAITLNRLRPDGFQDDS